MIIPDIFYVEDDPDYSFIIQHIVMKIDNTLTVKVITNGKEAMDVLMSIVETNKKPKLMLLDFNLPGLTGFELIKKIREIPFLNNVPVLMFSTANNPKDIKMCLDAGANEYIIKLSCYTNLVELVKSICKRWLSIAAIK